MVWEERKGVKRGSSWKRELVGRMGYGRAGTTRREGRKGRNAYSGSKRPEVRRVRKKVGKVRKAGRGEALR